MQWDAAKAELQPKLDAVTAAREAAAAAETARDAAAKAARQVARAGVGVDQPQDPAALCPANL